MARQNLAILTLTVTAAGAIEPHRFVTHTGAQAGAGANTLGVARTRADEGQDLAVDVLGTAIVEAGAAIAEGDALEADTQGRAVPQDTGPTAARALIGQSASAAGEFVEVALIPN